MTAGRLVALIPECAECGREPPELAFYCSSCAEREFHGD
jgi:hypothetical protein